MSTNSKWDTYFKITPIPIGLIFRRFYLYGYFVQKIFSECVSTEWGRGTKLFSATEMAGLTWVLFDKFIIDIFELLLLQKLLPILFVAMIFWIDNPPASKMLVIWRGQSKWSKRPWSGQLCDVHHER